MVLVFSSFIVRVEIKEFVEILQVNVEEITGITYAVRLVFFIVLTPYSCQTLTMFYYTSFDKVSEIFIFKMNQSSLADERDVDCQYINGKTDALKV